MASSTSQHETTWLSFESAGAGPDDATVSSAPPTGWQELAAAALTAPLPNFLDLARPIAAKLPRIGEGHTPQLWQTLANLAALDIAMARALEPHLDALDILNQAGLLHRADWLAQRPGTAGPENETTRKRPDTLLWGVYAAHGPALEARAEGGGWVLQGRKDWCSLAEVLDYALISVRTAGGDRLFAVDLRHRGVRPAEQRWAGYGLAEIDSSGLDLAGVPAIAVGEPNWYLDRPGFAWGGIGVAACWLGGAAGIHREAIRVAQRREPDQLALASLGESERLLRGCWALLRSTGTDIDAGRLQDRDRAWQTALTIRGNVAEVAHRVAALSRQLVGPAGLAFDVSLAKKFADLSLYLAQHKGSRDDASIGHGLLNGITTW